MPVAAVPAYLGNDFSSASPGMRFGVYLAIWATRDDQEQRVKKAAAGGSKQATKLRRILEEQGMDAAIAELKQRWRSFPGLWCRDDVGARNAWRNVCRLGREDRQRMGALIERQRALASSWPSPGAILSVDARAVAPFTTGLGNEHPLENGFAFLWPYGLPYLPGSGVKGVVRQAARELAQGAWAGDRRGWDDTPRFAVRDARGELLVGDLSMADVLFGRETEAGEREHFRGVLTFWDVIPLVSGGSLRIEVMTPHQQHYYQKDAPPHDCGDPIPIPFLTVPPGARFTFHVVCDEVRLRRVAPALLDDGPAHWRALVEAAFEHAFDWLGFGAKTAVGYGHMRVAQGRAEGAAVGSTAGAKGRQAPAPGRGSGAPEAPSEREETWREALLRYQPGNRLLTATRGTETARMEGEEAKKLVDALSKARQKKIRGEGVRATVVVRRLGNLLQIVRIEA